MSDELGISMDDLNYSYATAYCSLTVAALIFIPLSTLYGRRPVYLATSVIMLGSSIWMANIRTSFDVIASNFLSGIAGSVNEALFNVTVRPSNVFAGIWTNSRSRSVIYSSFTNVAP
jgi:MFS family permease